MFFVKMVQIVAIIFRVGISKKMQLLHNYRSGCWNTGVANYCNYTDCGANT